MYYCILTYNTERHRCSEMQLLKNLRFAALVGEFKKQITLIPDKRRTNSCQYDFIDSLSSGLACMFYKSPSMLYYQQAMEKKHYRNNLQTQFDVKNTPKDNQMRSVIGSVDSACFEPVYKGLFNRLERNKQLNRFRYGDYYFNTIDGTQYYSSEDIHCEQCLEQAKRNGKTHYSHKVLQSIVSHPSIRQVIPMMPEEIKREDGATKDDCEMNAAKRLIPKIHTAHPRLNFIWMADSLLAKTPIIKLLHQHNDHFIFNAKQGDHKSLYIALKSAEWEQHDVIGTKGKMLRYEWVCDIPLNDSSDIRVNVMRLLSRTKGAEGKKKVSYIGTWITDLSLSEDNIVFLVKAGRSRWKIENEGFNTLKNNGYNLEHNWGHKYGDVPFNFYHLTLLAFYMHQVLE